ncbi:MAG: hypothetical protein VW879_06550 [Opitutae bacterium]
MACNTYITWLERRLPNISRIDLLTAVNDALNRLLGGQTLRMMRISPDPYISTTDGVANNYYTASSVLYDPLNDTAGFDVRIVSYVYSRYTTEYSNPYQGTSPTSFKRGVSENPALETVKHPFECIPSGAPDSSDCQIRLWYENNPGTTTEKFWVEAYKWPTQLATESDTITIPVQFQKSLLYYEILMDLEMAQYGNVANVLPRKQEAWKDFLRYDGSIANSEPGGVTPKDF